MKKLTVALLLILAIFNTGTITVHAETPKPQLYKVMRVIDGDTIDVSIKGKTKRVRLIGVNTPETVDPRKPVECFGKEASTFAKSLMVGKKVSLQADPTQSDKDKYNRLLRYVSLADGTDVNLSLIEKGYAYEYTYNLPYKNQSGYKNAQKQAMDSKTGLWGSTCQNTASGTIEKTEETKNTPVMQALVAPNGTQSDLACSIKGNISSKDEKIYHVVGCQSYSKTVIDTTKGEKWFCSENEAVQAGWRKALNC